MRSTLSTRAGDTIPLQTFVDFAHGSDAVIHESVGPIYDFNFKLPRVRCFKQLGFVVYLLTLQLAYHIAPGSTVFCRCRCRRTSSPTTRTSRR